MASELDGMRIPSPLPDDPDTRQIPTHDDAAPSNWIIKIHYYLNLEVPINRMPDELLAEILQIVRDNCPPHWSFVTVLLICRHWYFTAVSSSSLWTYITTSMAPPVLETYLRRSRGANLSLSTPVACAALSQNALLNVLAPHFDRLVDLYTSSFQPYVEHRMEQLSSLVIDDTLPPDSGSTSPEVIAIRGDRFPKLECLTLRAIEPVARIVDAHSLTSLTLEDLWYETWSGFLDLLKGCPALEDLTLISLTTESTAVAAVGRRPIIALQHLQRLKFRDFDDRGGISYLLVHLALPSTAEIDIVIDMNPGLDEDILKDFMDHPDLWETSFASVIPADKTSMPMLSTIQTVKTTISDHRVKVLASALKEPCAGTQSVTYSCALRQLFAIDYMQAKIMHDLGTVFSSTLTALHIRVHSHDNYWLGGRSNEKWRRLYNLFPQIQDLYVGGPFLGFFADFLPDLGPDLPLKHLPLPWPKLRRITFENTATKKERNESDAIAESIITSMCNRRDAVLGERLQCLTLLFPAQRLNLYTGMSLMKLWGVTEQLVCTVRGRSVDNGHPSRGRDVQAAVDMRTNT